MSDIQLLCCYRDENKVPTIQILCCHYLSVLAYSQGSKLHTYHTVIIVHIIDICVHKSVRTQFEWFFFF